MPVLFNELAPRYADRPGGYTRIHLYGNRFGDNAPHAIIELVDGPQDLRFEMTARAVGRETADAAIQGLNKTDGVSASTLRPLTQRNLEKVLQYRTEEDKQRFRQIAAEWAVCLLSESEICVVLQ